MIKFVNAKLNFGLNILKKRPDGYHELSTLFYPVGIFNGTPENPEAFCDILEVTASTGKESSYRFIGNHIDCEPDRNLVVKAHREFEKVISHKGLKCQPVDLVLEKHIPDGAGLGGGSSDASFTLMALNELEGFPLDRQELIALAATIGADCPFFVLNRPALGSGIGEILHPVGLDLSGHWAVIVKPPIYVSTKEAFAGITPGEPSGKIEDIISRPVEQWDAFGLTNDFEPSIFKAHPELGAIKEHLYRKGAAYSAMSGSGSSLYGIFSSKGEAGGAMHGWPETYKVFLCKL